MTCRHFGACGGCQSQDVPYSEQLSRKRQLVTEMLARNVDAGVVAPVHAMPIESDGQPWRFRHKAAFVFGQGDGRSLLMGHYGREKSFILVVPFVISCSSLSS